jgi:predicted phage terminase large subunit-like protein
VYDLQIDRTENFIANGLVSHNTRWHEDDLAGRLLDQEAGEWTHLNLPALAEENDELGRAVGEPLCPALHSMEKLLRQKQKSSYWWASQYQQRPAPQEGFLFKRADLRYWREETRSILGAEVRMVVLGDGTAERSFDVSTLPRFQTCDVAMSERTTADWTVVATWTVTPDGDLILLDLDRRRFEEQRIVHFLKAQNDKHHRPPMFIERFGAGRSPLKILIRDGYPVRHIPVEAGTQTDKMTRSFGARVLAERHKLFLPVVRPDWLDAYEEELAAFPNAKHDDMVDATSYAARLLPTVTMGGKPAGSARPASSRPITAGIMSERF